MRWWQRRWAVVGRDLTPHSFHWTFQSAVSATKWHTEPTYIIDRKATARL